MTMSREQKYYFKKRAETHILPTPEGCHIWQGPQNQAGYGVVEYTDPISHKRKCTCIHRAYYAIVKDITLSRANRVKQKCKNRKCVNIEHLYVTEPPLW